MNSTVPLDRDELLSGFAAPAPARPAPVRPLRPAEAPRPAARRRPRVMAGALTAVGVILAIMAAQLGLSILVSQGAYEVRALQVEERDLSRVQSVLKQNLEKLSSPQNLAENATALGMVQNSQPATLRLSSGAVLGSLETRTSEPLKNTVPNATLESMPVVDAKGLLVSRNAAQPGAASGNFATTPVAWKGKLPAPDTH